MQIYSNERDDAGFYLVKITTVLDNLALLENVNGLFSASIDPSNPPASLIYTDSFYITIEMEDPIDEFILFNNTNPFFLPKPTDLYAYIGEAFTHSFGSAMDYETEDGQIVTVTVDLGPANSFASYDYNSNTILIDEGRTDEYSVKISDIIITLSDDYKDEFLTDDPGVTIYPF